MRTTRLRADLEAPVTGRSYSTPPSTHRARPSPYRLIQARGLGALGTAGERGQGHRPPFPQHPPPLPRRRRTSPALRLPSAPGPPNKSESTEKPRLDNRPCHGRLPWAVPHARARPGRRRLRAPPTPGPEASALRVAATPFPARPDSRKQLQPPGLDPSSPLALTFWMAAGVISPLPRCLEAAKATDMSGRSEAGPPPPPAHAPRGPSSGGRRQRPGKNAARGRRGRLPSGTAHPRPAGERLRRTCCSSFFSPATGSPDEAVAASYRSAKTTGPRAGTAPLEGDLSLSRDLLGHPFPSATLVRSCPTRLGAGRAAKWYGRRRGGEWERCAAHVTGAALRLCRAARAPPPPAAAAVGCGPGGPRGRGGAATAGRPGRCGELAVAAGG